MEGHPSDDQTDEEIDALARECFEPIPWRNCDPSLWTRPSNVAQFLKSFQENQKYIEEVVDANDRHKNAVLRLFAEDLELFRAAVRAASAEQAESDQRKAELEKEAAEKESTFEKGAARLKEIERRYGKFIPEGPAPPPPRRPYTKALPDCELCGKAATQSCSNCLYVHYCTKKCQKEHWKEHKEWCQRSPQYAQQQRLTLLNGLLEDNEKLLGADHPDTLASASSLGCAYRQAGRRTEAEALLFRCYESRKNVLGPQDDSTLVSACLLASLYSDSLRYREAEEYFNVAIAGFEKNHSPHHFLTLSAVSGLGALYYAQKRYSEAEPCFVRDWEGSMKDPARGPLHDETNVSANNLAQLLQVQGKFEQAEALFRSSYENFKKALGDDNPKTLLAACNLGGALKMQKPPKFAEAETFFRLALSGQERILGRDHNHTIGSVNNLAVLLHETGRAVEAEAFYRRALEAFERTKGDHNDTLVAVGNLATFLRDREKSAESEPFCLRALELSEKLWGVDHTETIYAAERLAICFKILGKRDQCDEILIKYKSPLYGK